MPSPLAVEFDEYGNDDRDFIEVPNARIIISMRNGTSKVRFEPAWMVPIYKLLWSKRPDVTITSERIPVTPLGKRDRYAGMRTTKIVSLHDEKQRLRDKWESRNVVSGSEVQSMPLFDAVYPADSFDEAAMRLHPDLFGAQSEQRAVVDKDLEAARAKAQAEEDALYDELSQDEPAAELASEPESAPDVEISDELMNDLRTLPHVGPAKAKALVAAFGVTSLQDVADLSVAEVTQLPSTSDKQAEEIIDAAAEALLEG